MAKLGNNQWIITYFCFLHNSEKDLNPMPDLENRISDLQYQILDNENVASTNEPSDSWGAEQILYRGRLNHLLLLLVEPLWRNPWHLYILFEDSQHADKQNKREDLFHLCILRIEVLDYENRKGTSLLACATSLQLQVLLHINIYISIFQTEAMSHDKKNCALMIKRDYRPDPHRPSALYCCRLLAPS